MKRELLFFAGCLFELALFGLALLWSWVFHWPALVSLHCSAQDTLFGLLAILPPFAFFLWTLHADVRLFARHRHLLESLLRPMFEKWRLWELAVISSFAGLGEEAFFRGAIQGNLTETVGVALALLLSSLAFGAAHLITWAYAIITAFIGAYLGLLWLWTGNLLTPMVTHAAYDFAALVYFLRFYRPRF